MTIHFFRRYAFVEAAALRSIVLRYAGAPVATRVSSFFILLFIWRCRFFRVFFVLFPLSLCMESTSCVLSFRMVFSYLVTTGWIYDISSCENSINQSIISPVHVYAFSARCRFQALYHPFYLYCTQYCTQYCSNCSALLAYVLRLTSPEIERKCWDLPKTSLMTTLTTPYP